MRGIKIRLVPDVTRRGSSFLSDARTKDIRRTNRRVGMVQEGT
jgi:hypothetical protein